MAYVCSCHGISDRTVRAAISAGANCVEDVTAMCRASGNCGSCAPTIESLLAIERVLSVRSTSSAA